MGSTGPAAGIQLTLLPMCESGTNLAHPPALAGLRRAKRGGRQ